MKRWHHIPEAHAPESAREGGADAPASAFAVQAAPSTFSCLYEGADGRLCLFETRDGHLVSVKAARLL